MSNVKCVALSACIIFTRHTYILSVRTRCRSLKDTENTDTYTYTHTRKKTDRQTDRHTTHKWTVIYGQKYKHECSVVFVVIMIAALTGYPQQVQS